MLGSVRLNESDRLDYTPFLLSEEVKAPTRFEIEFMLDLETSYRYGFSYTEEKIEEEWLFVQVNKKKEVPLFIRADEGIAVSKQFGEGKGKEELTNSNRLFISLVAQLNGSVSKTILEWFSSCKVISGLEQGEYKQESLEMLKNGGAGFAESLSFYNKLQLGFQKIFVKEERGLSDVQSMSLIIPNIKGPSLIKTTHNKYDNEGNVVGSEVFDKNTQESAGTNKVIDLSGPLFSTLLNGGLLVVDELDAKLHPLLTRQIVLLFNDPEMNSNNAQLIFATHDTNLLSTEIFRRDQIWFTEKDSVEQTDLYSLVEFKFPDGTIPRKDSNLEKNYIRGRYGAIPFITFN